MERLQTKEEELQAVLAGTKPAALGYWEKLPSKVLVYDLQPVFGRYYDMAIALTEKNLHTLVAAYYMPLSPDADIALGLALGYPRESTLEYIKSVPYPKIKTMTKEERTRLKLTALIQKRGFNAALGWVEDLTKEDPLMVQLAEKESIDLKTILGVK